MYVLKYKMSIYDDKMCVDVKMSLFGLQLSEFVELVHEFSRPLSDRLDLRVEVLALRSHKVPVSDLVGLVHV